MSRAFIAIMLLCALACGGESADSAVSEAVENAVDEATEAAAAADAPVSKKDMTSEQSCEVLQSGVLDGVFEVEEPWSFRPASRGVPQALCTATANGSPSVEVSLMIMKSDFDSPAAAVTSLESTVESLTEGITIQVGGKEYTRKVEFEPFLDGVGDQAAWAPKMNELSVADRGTRFAVTVKAFDDGAMNKEKAIELAHAIGEAL